LVPASLEYARSDRESEIIPATPNALTYLLFASPVCIVRETV